MLQVRFSRSFTVLLIFLTLMHPCGGQPHVISPSEPIVATLGDDVTLPCRLDPVMDASLMTVEWARPDLDPRFVFVWRGSVELESKKHPSYRGRTTLFTDGLKHGNISLKLSRVKISDEGTYRCFMPELNKQSFVQLVVGAASSPVVQMTRNSSSVVLQCESAGWYPQPEVSWLDGEGNLLSAGPTETSRGPDDLYTVISRLTVEKRHGNSFTCRVQHKNINQTRDRNIQIPDEFFADQSGSGSSAPAIIAVVVVLVLVVVAVLAVWKWRQNRMKNKEHHEDEETRNTPEHESLLGQDNGEQQAVERKTDSLDTRRGETGPQTDQEQDNNVQHPANEGAGTQLSVEQEGRKTETLVREKEDVKTKKDTDDQRENLTAKEKFDDRESSLDESNKETGLQRQTDEETHRMQDINDQRVTNDGAVAQSSEEEEHDEQLTAGREKLNDKQQQLMKKLKTKEKDEKKHEDKIIKLESQIKDKEKQIKDLKQQLEEVERRRQSAEDENRDRTDLERQKDELQKDLEKKQNLLEKMEKDKRVIAQRKLKTTSEKEEIMKNLKEEEIRQQPSTQSRDVNDPMEDLTSGMMSMAINAEVK